MNSKLIRLITVAGLLGLAQPGSAQEDLLDVYRQYTDDQLPDR